MASLIVTSVTVWVMLAISRTETILSALSSVLSPHQSISTNCRKPAKLKSVMRPVLILAWVFPSKCRMTIRNALTIASLPKCQWSLMEAEANRNNLTSSRHRVPVQQLCNSKRRGVLQITRLSKPSNSRPSITSLKRIRMLRINLSGALRIKVKVNNQEALTAPCILRITL